MQPDEDGSVKQLLTVVTSVFRVVIVPILEGMLVEALKWTGEIVSLCYKKGREVRKILSGGCQFKEIESVFYPVLQYLLFCSLFCLVVSAYL